MKKLAQRYNPGAERAGHGLQAAQTFFAAFRLPNVLYYINQAAWHNAVNLGGTAEYGFYIRSVPKQD